MWDEKILKVMPAVLFLFCILQTFELGLTILDLYKTEKLEKEVKNNLEALESINETLHDLIHAQGMKK
ncbi:hypothetical protein [Helicobacter acinonychis]|uniref:hypothetical protein n=1 Tax=Helicobacter acinonychis TaxID=212 RepID=UPI000CF13801|nr:hypothetical protein [Helicobacter acinonychis]